MKKIKKLLSLLVLVSIVFTLENCVRQDDELGRTEMNYNNKIKRINISDTHSCNKPPYIWTYVTITFNPILIKGQKKEFKLNYLLNRGFELVSVDGNTEIWKVITGYLVNCHYLTTTPNSIDTLIDTTGDLDFVSISVNDNS